ncbi:hypothetical protein K438DRAFT_878324 [Mycena galopus ATCC 62051]|nr:hypothetical protein K438DRAFT_878324 [Mycena galopus ATCC 62051]
MRHMDVTRRPALPPLHQRAQAWYMRAWSSMEIAAATRLLLGLPHGVVLDTLRQACRAGRTEPICDRAPYGLSMRTDRADRSPGQHHFFACGPPRRHRHRGILIQPQLETNQQGKTRLQRRDYEAATWSTRS